MKKSIYIISIVLSMLVVQACGEPTLEDDAQKAAELTSLSNQYTMDNDLSRAGKAYEEVQEIINKYKQQDKFDEFYQLYISILQEQSYTIDEGAE